MKFLRYLSCYESFFEREWFIGLVKLSFDILFVLFVLFLVLVVVAKIIEFICYW